jgi:hypothetical protein
MKMRRIRAYETAFTAIILTTVCLSAIAASSKEQTVQFFAGVFILQSKTDLSPAEKTKKYRELETVTGVTTAQAQALIAAYRTKPAEWQKLYDSISCLITQVQPAEKKGAAPALPAKRR